MPHLSFRLASRAVRNNGLHRTAFRGWTPARLSSSITRQDEPLRILFCGSDDFSVTSLEALHQYSKTKDSNVASIDVATKKDKRTGRGLKKIEAPLIKHAATRLGLPLHQFDTFRGWSLPLNASGESYINMVIAVSFGLLVPPRILGACQFGGINVHPSMLPDLKGSAPIEHAIMNGYSTTGVTIQTLHPSKFDEGRIILQSPHPGIPIPSPDSITAGELKGILAPIGARMLVQTLRDRLYIKSQGTEREQLDHAAEWLFAPKLSKEDARVDFRAMDATQILRRHRALGKLWLGLKAENSTQDLRLTFGPVMRIAHPSEFDILPEGVWKQIEPGQPFVITTKHTPVDAPKSPLLVRAADGTVIVIPELAISGQNMGMAPSERALRKAKLLSKGFPINDSLEVRLLSITST